jgi:hypothetical protein
MTVRCFACEPTSSPGGILRALCASHKATCELSDGAQLSTMLSRAEPPDYPLDGSGLAWVYNPVFVRGRDGTRLRGWTDFVAGGVAVYEDRFASRDVFEFWMCQRKEMAELLRGVRARFGSGSIDWTTLLGIGEASWANRAKVAWHCWYGHRIVQQRRLALGRWPDSSQELEALFQNSDPPVPRESPDLQAFLNTLSELAERYDR